MKRLFQIQTDYDTGDFRSIEELGIVVGKRKEYNKCYYRGGGVLGLYYTVWAGGLTDALRTWIKFLDND